MNPIPLRDDPQKWVWVGKRGAYVIPDGLRLDSAEFDAWLAEQESKHEEADEAGQEKAG